jgi:hypothetical protein
MFLEWAGFFSQSLLKFATMIKSHEFRLGNYLMHKTGVRILTVRCTFDHFALLSKGGEKDMFPVVLSVTIVEKCGFTENKKYALLPESREFILVLPVMGGGDMEVRAYVKNNKECFGRVMINGVPVSNNFHHLHQLQNTYFALTGTELEVRL